MPSFEEYMADCWRSGRRLGWLGLVVLPGSLLVFNSCDLAGPSSEESEPSDDPAQEASAGVALPRFGAPQKWSGYFCVGNEVCRAADVNADGRADLVAFTHGPTPQVWVGLSTGSAFAPAVKWSDYFCTSSESCEVADVDGDGRSDVIAFTRGPDDSAWVALSHGAGFGHRRSGAATSVSGTRSAAPPT
jgi:hypothetical protein